MPQRRAFWAPLRSPVRPLAILAVALLWSWQPCSGYAVAGDGAVKSQYDDAFYRGREAYRRRDFADTLATWRRAAEAGSSAAMTELGSMYEKGEGTPRDFAAAAEWYLEAWDRGGDKWAAYRLSQFYENGLGVEKNRAVANFKCTLAINPAAMCG
jgi:TPR repeat protein